MNILSAEKFSYKSSNFRLKDEDADEILAWSDAKKVIKNNRYYSRSIEKVLRRSFWDFD